MCQILRAGMQLIASWWNQDRIRIPRAEGQLLRVIEGDRLIIDDTLLQVECRTEVTDRDSPELTIALRELDSPSCELWYLTYTIDGGGLPYGNASHRSDCVMLRRGNELTELLPNQICVLRREFKRPV